MRHLLVSLSVAAALLCCVPAALRAWGPEGHFLVARIALSQMTPETKRAVLDLLEGDDFVASATWADEIRSQRPESYNWHFVNIPYSEMTYVPERDCKPTASGDCVIAELERNRRVLSDATAPKAIRKEALKFLIHFVADLHQPLHAIDSHDRGGNDVHVVLDGRLPPPRPLNLHAVWDTTLISLSGMDEAAYLNSLLRDLRTNPVSPFPLDFVKWAQEAHQIAVEYVYTYKRFSPSGPPADPIELNAEYQKKAPLAIDHQLELAGVRLAGILNGAFAK
jgi:hypothetical protein